MPASLRRSPVWSMPVNFTRRSRRSSPCDMCSGTVLLYKIPRVVIGENRTFQGPEDYLRSRGVDIQVIDSAECVAFMKQFIQEHPSLWNEDIGELGAA